jgi:hypothetical protein
VFRRVLATALLAGATILLSGCGGQSATSTGGGPTAKTGFDELAEVIKAMNEQKQKPPEKLADLKRYEPIAEAGFAELTQNKIVYVWGAGYKAGGTGVVAYESGADANGGWVLLEDASVKQMSAAEFSSAPKAGRK